MAVGNSATYLNRTVVVLAKVRLIVIRKRLQPSVYNFRHFLS